MCASCVVSRKLGSPSGAPHQKSHSANTGLSGCYNGGGLIHFDGSNSTVAPMLRQGVVQCHPGSSRVGLSLPVLWPAFTS